MNAYEHRSQASLINSAAQICKLCGAIDQEMLFEASGYPIMQCRKCGLAFTGIVPTVAAEQYYHTQYFASAHAYADALMRQTAAGTNPDHDERVRQVSLLARRAGGEVLDVGCAAGALLVAFKRAGWNCFGIEPSEQLADYARQYVCCEVYECTLETCDLSPQIFDVVTAIHVLEHSLDPARFIESCRRLLREKGLLLVEVPDFGSRQSRKCGNSWIPLYPDTHLYHFSAKTLSQLLQKHGFRVLRVRRYGGLGNLYAKPPSGHEMAPTDFHGVHRLTQPLMRALFENRESLYRVPALKGLMRYLYWHLFRMNDCIRVYAVRTN